ncbi:MAG: asparagine synthase (glutamine-hydrolyzing), partial [Gemmatimonadales bacterium]
GSRRLSIIDLSPAGHQPMVTADGRHVIVYNGEIYNYLELRAELEKLGRRFRSLSDTEVLLQAWAEWGPAAVPRLVGMFAFAVFDIRERRLYLARDCFGIKPLYYALPPGGLAFASEISALLEFPGIGRRINPRRLHDYLVSSNTGHGGETLFADIQQLPAAHYLTIPLEGSPPAGPVRYWDLDLTARCDLSFEEAAGRLRELFLDSVRLHLRSDVPLGFALSGGLDSSSVVVAARHLGGSTQELHTFSYIADDPLFSEERYVDAVTAGAGAVEHKLHLLPHELPDDYDALHLSQGEPFGSPTIYAQRRILRSAREAGMKVVLSGQGSDELLAGYDRYVPARLASLVAQGHWGQALDFLDSAGRIPGIRRGGLIRSAVGMGLPRGMRRLLRQVRGKRPFHSWIDWAWFTRQGVEPEPAWTPRSRMVMRELLYETLTNTHLQALMRYEDRNGMAFSLESRVPFLTPAIASFAFSLPEEYLLAPDGTRKAVFRRAMRGLVPDLILDRRDKIGFAMPIVQWLLDLRPWVEEKLAAAEGLPGLNSVVVRRQWEAVRAVRSVKDAFLIWRWISLATWADRFQVDFG